MPLEVFREHTIHDLNVPEHGVEFGLNEDLDSPVVRLPDGLASALVLGEVADGRQNHLGITDPR